MHYITAESGKSGVSFKVTVIVSTFNRAITTELKKGALQQLSEAGILAQDVTVIEVPGAVEIPFIAKQIAIQDKTEVIIALGAVVRGDTTHYDYVCEQVSFGCQRVALDYDIPVVFGVLTTENEEQAWDRLGGRHGHKGVDAANCAIDMYKIVQQLK